jgi:hypothetical protein
VNRHIKHPIDTSLYKMITYSINGLGLRGTTARWFRFFYYKNLLLTLYFDLLYLI